jgi:hypothetical protein
MPSGAMQGTFGSSSLSKNAAIGMLGYAFLLLSVVEEGQKATSWSRIRDHEKLAAEASKDDPEHQAMHLRVATQLGRVTTLSNFEP